MAHINIFIPQILHDIWINKFRSGLAIFCIAFGVFSVVLLSALGEGFYKASVDDLSGLTDDSYIVWQNKSSKSSRGYPKGKVNWITIQDVLKLPEVIPDVLAVSPLVSQPAAISYNGRSYNRSVVGVSQDYTALNKINFVAGSRFISQFDLENSSRVVIINWQMKEIIFGKKEALRERILINHVPFTVVGVLSEDSERSGIMDGGLYISYQSYMSLFSDHQCYLFMAKARPGVEHVKFEQELRTYFSGRNHFDKNDENAIGFWGAHKVSNFIKWFFVGVRIFLGFCGLMILVVGGIGVANIMFLIVADKTYEIGLRKAVGAKDQQVLLQLFLEALFIVVMGGCLGMAVAYFTVIFLQQVNLPAWIGVPNLSWLTIAITLISLGLIGLATGFYPARRAARIDPVEALMI